MKKLKILLGAYIDTVNAQNINCYEIAKRLDTNQFEIHVLYHKNVPFEKPGVIYHKVRENRFLRNLDKLKIMINGNFDLYYLPRVEKVDLIFSKMFGKKRCITSSVEIENALYNSRLKKFFNTYIFDYFSISGFLKTKVKELWSKESELIYLGCNHPFEKINIKEKLNNIAFVGSVTERKRPFLFLECAKQFPDITFTMIGTGDLFNEVKEYVKKNHLNNVVLKGQIGNKDVYKKLYDSDLLLILSEIEGLPKIALEAASVGTPTLYINKKYNIDYINNGVNGIGVETFEDVVEEIKRINMNKVRLNLLSKNAYEMSKNYDWDSLILKYNNYFKNIYSKFLEQK